MTTATYSTGLTKVNDTFLPMIQDQLTGNGINMDGYSKQCVLNALSSINAVLESKGLTFNDPQLDKNNVTTILLQIASLKLNAAASPREVYFQLRNVKVTKPDKSEEWKKQIEMGIEGDGNDAILSRFGRDVKKVAPYWLVREEDIFEYPKFTGLSYEPPVWQPTGKGDVVRVVYPILQEDDSIQFYISERDDVSRNLIAHINNGMMNETFGVCPDRYKATPDQKKKIATIKSEYLKKAKDLGLGALDDPELQQWISPAWTEYHSRESMLIRKMRNNVVKKIPKDFGNAFVEMIHNEATDVEHAELRREIESNANGPIIDIKPEPTKADPPSAAAPPKSPDPEPKQEDINNPDKAVGDSEPEPKSFDQAILDFENQNAAGSNAADPGW